MTAGALAPGADPVAFLAEARARIQAFHRGSDSSGSRITRLYTAAVDNTLRGLHGRLADGASARARWMREDFCLVATGGYARKTLCPFSDVDVMLLSREPSPDALADAARALLYPLWDSRLAVGQHPGTVEEILARAEGELSTQTALLELRFLAGSRAMFEGLEGALRDALDRWRGPLLDRVAEENRRRFRRYGNSVFLLEPHVKEGKGGLRDFHWLGWLARLLRDLHGDYDLLLSGLLEPEQYRALVEAYEFLLRVRVQLHGLHGRAEDRLLFEAQEPVARALGFRAGRGLLAVERFMGRYYRHAWDMAHSAGLYVARLLGSHWDEGEPEGAGPLLLGPSAPVLRPGWESLLRSEDGLFVRQQGEIACADAAALGREPRRLLDLFRFAQTAGGRLHHDTMEQVRAAARRLGRRFREDPDVAARFRELLEGPDVFRILAAMHRTGLLGRLLPEFGACFCQAQHNRVHLYTVDVHSLYVVREMESLGSPAAREAAAPFALAWRSASERGPLLLAALLHDVAKAHGAAHSRVGAELAGNVMLRLGYGEADARRVQWLVAHHLLLSETAYHRDVYDPHTMETLRAVIPDRRHLDELAVLTWADTRGTNPELLTSWKQSLLEATWRAAAGALAGGAADGAAAGSRLPTLRAQVEALLEAELGRKHAPELARRLFTVALESPPAWLERATPEVLVTHAVLLDQLAAARAHAESEPFVTHVHHRPELGASQWTVATMDRPGVFSLLCGTLAACGLSIVTAEALTRADGVCLDTFWVTDSRGRLVDEPARWRRLERTLQRVARGEEDLQHSLERSRKSAARAPRPGALGLRRVEVRNDLSRHASVVEVVTPDRIGLLHDVTRVFADFGLDLRVAKIATRHDLASDTFCLVDARGRQLGRRRARQLREALEARLR